MERGRYGGVRGREGENGGVGGGKGGIEGKREEEYKGRERSQPERHQDGEGEESTSNNINMVQPSS